MGKGRRAADRRREREGSKVLPEAGQTSPGLPGVPAAGAADDDDDEHDDELLDADGDDQAADNDNDDDDDELEEISASAAQPQIHSELEAAPAPTNAERRRPSQQRDDHSGDPEQSFVRAVRASSTERHHGAPLDATAVRSVKRTKKKAAAGSGGKLAFLDVGGAPVQAAPLAIAVAPALLGRSQACDVRLDDPAVSLRHAELRHDGERFSLFDLGSTSGTLVNGVPVDGEVVLRHGDVIAVGKTTLRFLRADKPPEEKPEPEPPALEATEQLPDRGTIAREATSRTAGTRVGAAQTRPGTEVRKAQAAAAAELQQRVRRTALRVMAASAVLFVVVLAGRAVYLRVFSDESKPQIRAQIAELLADGRKKLNAQDVDGARSAAETVLALDPTNQDAESLAKMAHTESDSRDAISLALRLGDEERDAEAAQILRRVPDASVFASTRDRLKKSLEERGIVRSRRAIESLLDQGRIDDAVVAAATHVDTWPNDADGQALKQRVDEARKRIPKNPLLSLARQRFAAGDIAGARAAATEGGYRGYLADLDRFEQSLDKGKDALKRLDEKAAAQALDDAFRLLSDLGGSAQSAIVAEVKKPYAKSLFLQATGKIDRGDLCGASRDLLRAARVSPDSAEVQGKLRELDGKADAGLQRARAAKLQDPDRAAAIAREHVCMARTGTSTYEELRALARM